jgi:hypothetical protein
MRILLFVLGIFVVIAGINTHAEAQNYPWCAYYGTPGGTNCGFTTYQQCMAALSGNGGFCNQNTQYQPPAGPHPQPQKSHTHY